MIESLHQAILAVPYDAWRGRLLVIATILVHMERQGAPELKLLPARAPP